MVKNSFRFAIYFLGVVSFCGTLVGLFMVETGGETPQVMSLFFYSIPLFVVSFAFIYYDIQKTGCVRAAKPEETVLLFDTPENFRQSLMTCIPAEGYALVSRMQGGVALWWKKAFHIASGIEVGENFGIVVGSGKETLAELRSSVMNRLNNDRFRWSFLYVNYGYGIPEEWKEILSVSTKIHLGLNAINADVHAYYDLETKTLYMQKITQGKRNILYKSFHQIWDNLGQA